jgi:molybdate transport system regulatory protein
VSLTLPGGQTIVAVLTHESTETLGLAPGAAAFALIKASWVILLADDDGIGTPVRLSARNQLRGTVSAVTRGGVNAEVSVALDIASAGTTGVATVVTAVITNESVDTLGLEVGRPVVAAFKASSVILGVTE